ncbi:Pentatricopeptide repeat-containing protein At4g04790, mitochondrial [Linum perenne]
MSRSKALSSIFGAAVKSVKTSSAVTECSTPILKTTSTSAVSSPSISSHAVEHFVSTIDACSKPTFSSSSSATKRSAKLPKKRSIATKNNPCLSSSTLPDLKLEASDSDSVTEVTATIAQEVAAIIYDQTYGVLPNAQGGSGDDEKSLGHELTIPWTHLTCKNLSHQQKVSRRERKEKWIFSSSQVNRVERLARCCVEKLGSDTTFNVFGKIGRETGVKEFDALIKSCLKIARQSKDLEIILKHVSKCFRFLSVMKEQGFQIEENTYGPVLMYLIEMSMVEEFHLFLQAIRTENASPLARLGYYEMLLYITVGDEQKIQELCSSVSSGSETGSLKIHENYLLALCESNRKNDLLPLLDVIDVTKVQSMEHLASIFNAFGRLSLESFATKFLLAFKSCEMGKHCAFESEDSTNDAAEKISTLICSYATEIPNLEIHDMVLFVVYLDIAYFDGLLKFEDVMLKVKELHSELAVKLSIASYEELIAYCCDQLEVYAALDLVYQIYEDKLAISMDTFHKILDAVDESMEFILVRRLYPLISNHDLQPTIETFKKMINLSVKMQDFDLAYGMLEDIKKRNLNPTPSMYNVIMGGHFRQKRSHCALMVLEQMELANVQPDTQTYSYLIGNCESEDEIVKYHEKMQLEGVKVNKYISMALVNAYAACGQFEKAKQVLVDQTDEALNEVKSVVISALACHGQYSDALTIFKETKAARNNVAPKAVISLIEYFPSDGEKNELLELLEEVHDSVYWADACCRVVVHCIRQKHLSCLVDLLKRLTEKFRDDEMVMDVIFDEFFATIADTEPADVRTGMKLLGIIKTELGLSPSRKCLDFLLHTCGKAKDLPHARAVWKEYEIAHLPYNVMSYLRMYQVLMATGGHTLAKTILSKIPKDDRHVRMMIKTCRMK